MVAKSDIAGTEVPQKLHNVLQAEGTTQMRKWPTIKWPTVIAGFVVLGAALLWLVAPAHIAAPLQDPQGSTPRQVTMEVFSGTKNGQEFFGTFTFGNKGAADVKNIRVTCTHYGAGGAVINANTRTIYETVKAKSSKTIRGFNMGPVHSQAVRSSCAIADYVTL